VQTFSTTKDLRDHLSAFGSDAVDAVFHAAAVSDFTFGKVWNRSEQGQLTEITAGKLSTRAGTLLAELLPTPKIISQLREFFPKALLVGWKYEVDGDRGYLIRLAQQQMASCRTDACVANGPAYGPGFGLVQGNGFIHHETTSSLFAALGTLARQPVRIPTSSIV
jgi:phosphopantothenoylcysteine decarboxylase/phosphopantothenate--cysteine ligase